VLVSPSGTIIQRFITVDDPVLGEAEFLAGAMTAIKGKIDAIEQQARQQGGYRR